MREILFRGKIPSECQDFDDGYWVEGFYTRFNGKEHRIYTGYAETDCGDYYPDWCNVRPETVGQFTGLIDKNGKRIFEGDIVQHENDIGVVSYSDSFAKFRVVYNQLSGNWFDFEGEECYPIALECEVIGNIHDNPELLEVR